MVRFETMRMPKCINYFGCITNYPLGIPWQSKVRTQRFQCQGPDSILDQGIKIPQTKWDGKKKKRNGRETNYPKLKWLKTNVDYIIVSKHQESRSNLAEWDLAWDLSWVTVTLVRATPSEVLLGLEGPLPKWLIHRAGGWCWLSDRVSQTPDTGVLPVVSSAG